MRAAASFAGLMLALAVPAGAQRIVFDPHVDLPPSAASPNWTGASDPSSQFDLDRLQAGGVNAIGLALFVPQGERVPASENEARWAIAARHAALRRLVDANPGRVALALSPPDVRAAAKAGKLAVVATILNAWPLGNEPGALDSWYKHGVRIVGFSHAGHNQYADSSRPALPRGEKNDAQGGLTALGKAAVTQLNDLGILIDVSQLSDLAFNQTLALSRSPVVASHSDVRARVDSPRNLTDAQLDALKANGGVIAINAYRAYLRPDSAATTSQLAALRKEFGLSADGSPALTAAAQADYTRRYYAIRAEEPKASVADLADAIDYAVKRIGIDHVAISSDFNHGGGVTGWAHAGETPNVTAELRKRGYSSSDIDKLWGENLLRVWQAAIDKRRNQARI